MSMFGALNRSVFKRTSTFLLVVAGGSFFFERTFDLVAVSIFESINKGKLWKDVQHKFSQ
ncbi:ubiquinol-cytochrome C reductase complex subunit oxen [Choristoneura fumiferana]|uniref:ubiquinol-cytochrome C reductase complex subunit oxen n=1 Tax=Choristoneura fumiferana TaxID=7141 RepID=UPI003D155F50